MSSRISALCLGFVLLGWTAVSEGGSVMATFSGDNQFFVYVSNDDSLPGIPVGSSPGATPDCDPVGWGQGLPVSIQLQPGFVNYIHVVVVDLGGAAGFIGEMSIDGDFQFADGSKRLLTGSEQWRVSRVGFGQAYETPGLAVGDLSLSPGYEAGENGVWPWGYQSLISPQAKWIWTDGDWNPTSGGTRYFSVALAPAAVPLPSAAWAGLALMGVVLGSRVLRSQAHPVQV